jgi:hypothetical protein
MASPLMGKSGEGRYLAGWNESLVCRGASRRWRERLGVADMDDEPDIPLSEVFVLESAARLTGGSHYGK